MRSTWFATRAVERVDPNALFRRRPAVDYPQRLQHRIPGWVESGALFHIRIRASPEQVPPLSDAETSGQLLAAAARYHELGHWWCELFLLMPDHVHLIAGFPRDKGMSLVVRNWKRGTAKFQHVVWQENYFDHRLRDQEDGRKTWVYIRRNPVVKGLCAEIADWKHWCSPAYPREKVY